MSDVGPSKVKLLDLIKNYKRTPGVGITQACIPGFIFSIGSEIIYSCLYLKETNIYRVSDTINSLSCGVVQQLFGLWIFPFIDIPYQYVYHNFRLFNFSDNWRNFFIFLIFADLAYYWAHRLSHEYNFAWAAHSVHHNSENFNLSTALRQSAFQQVCMIFWNTLPNALLGVPPRLWSFHNQLNTVLQFWIHTQYVRNLGPIEYIFNTPRQHINHHARAPGLCNSNYAGVFSVWDQMFGTFDLENAPDKFGIVDKPDTFDPVTIHIRNFTKLFSRMSRKVGVWEKLKVLGRSGRFEMDSCQDEDIHKPLRFNPILSVRSQIYSGINFAVLIVDYLFLSISFQQMPILPTRALSSLYLLGALSSLGQYLNKSRWSRYTEILKHGLLLSVLCSRKMSNNSLWQGTLAHQIMKKWSESNGSLPWGIARFTLIAVGVLSLAHLYTREETINHEKEKEDAEKKNY